MLSLLNYSCKKITTKSVFFFQQMQVSALIVSAQFWPSLKQEDIILPAPVTEALEKYTKAFEMIKGNRTLEWQKHIGTVKLEIEHGGVKASFSVSPIQATIIWHFQEQGELDYF